MRILLTGATGLLGRSIWEELKDSYQILPTSLSGRDGTIKCDLRDEESVSKVLNDFHPDLIIHTAAVTDVDLCEEDPKFAHEVNTIGTRNIVWYASQLHSAFIYISTDYVFDGEKRSPYEEDDDPCPINVYGVSKLGGEKYVSYFMEEYFILRTSLLYGPDKGNFVQFVAERLKEGKEVLAAVDQIVSPTYTKDFAKALKGFLKEIVKIPQDYPHYGIYHIVNEGKCTRLELVQEIARILDADRKLIKAVRLDEIRGKARRPNYCALSCKRFEEFTGYRMRDWKQALSGYLSSLCGVRR